MLKVSRISISSFPKKNLALWKKGVMHIITLMHYKARQVLLDLVSTNQGNGSEMTFVAWATKINIRYLKT